MNGKINNTLIASLKPASKPVEVNDSELKGFGLRVQPTGAKSFYVRYRLRGKQTRFILGRTTEMTPAQARDSARHILASINLGSDPSERRKPVPVPKSLGEFIDEDYAPWLLANRKAGDSTLARIRAQFKEYWSRPLDKVDALLIEKWRTRRLNHAKRPAKAATVNRDLNALKAAFSRALDWKLIDVHPLKQVKLADVDSNGIVRFLSAAERARLFAAVEARDVAARAKRESGNVWRRERGYPEMKSLQAQPYADHLKPAIVVSLNTGLRQGELFSLLWSDVDFNQQQLSVRGSNAKSGKTRHVPLNEAALEALTLWGSQVESRSGFVFAGAGGKRMVDLKTSWARLLEAAKIKGFRWHDMRHDFASSLVMLGVDLNTVRELLGHADLKMTLRYAHLAPEHKAAAVAKLARGSA